MTTDALGDRCKAFEMADNSKKAMIGIPLLARLDGKAFHTFTKGMQRPYDVNMQTCMIETTKHLVDQSHAIIGYTQSDEISLLWFAEYGTESQYMFDGRIQKLTSVLASMASSKFVKLLPQYLPSKAHLLPCFDCRVWQVPTKMAAFDAFLWREEDATKNSISMAAQAYYSHKDLHKKDSSAKQEMLHQKGINWNDYPDSFKRGTFIRKVMEMRPLTEEEFLKIPEKNRPERESMVVRTKLNSIACPPLRRIGNPVEFLFDGVDPTPRGPGFL